MNTLPVSNDFSYWRTLSTTDPEAAAQEFHRRLAAVPAEERRAAIAGACRCEVLEDEFRESGRVTDLENKQPLAGVPYLAKDLFDVAGWSTGAGSVFLAEERGVAGKSSAACRDLGAKGAVFAGKTHLVEFAYGTDGRNPHFGDCPHPRFSERLSGGSSSGSAWAVGKGLVPLALGTDTAGSIRVPAAFCGLFGLRMEPGPWSREGVFPLAPSFDAAGWFTTTVADMHTTIPLFMQTHTRLPVNRGLYIENVGPVIEDGLRARYRALANRLGAECESAHGTILRAAFDDAETHYNVLGSREAWAVHEEWLPRFGDRYDPAVRARLQRAKLWSDAQVQTANAQCNHLGDAFSELFVDYDFVLMPAVHAPAPLPAESDGPFRDAILRLNTPASLARLPVLTVPVFLPGGLSGGMQVIFRNNHSPVPLRVLEALAEG